MSLNRLPRSAVLNALILLGWFCAFEPAQAQPADYLPKELEGVGVTEHLNAQLPLDLDFVDESGRPVKLGSYFDGRRPVILTLNYYRCPMLCTLQLNGLIDGLRRMDWTPGEQFEIVTVSFDPAETPSLAKAKKDNYLGEYGRPSAAKGWHFLTGKQKSIKTLTETVGFGYKWNADRGQWIHIAALYACTPDGRVSRYLYGVMFEPGTLRFSLIEASEGKVGSTLDQIILYCYHYDSATGKYSLGAMSVMRIGGGLTLLALAAILGTLWRREARRRRAGVSQEQGRQ